VDKFSRYRPIIADWEAFCAIARAPLPICIRVNRSRVSDRELQDWLAESGIFLEPIAWCEGAYRWHGSVRPGQHLAYLLGLYQIQEEVALLPALLLGVRPGERILDLCAAPGNKTAQIAQLMQQKGTLVANDRNRHRLRVLRSALERQGIMQVTTTVWDGANYPAQSGYFDRVLVDVPCSCEGTMRKHSSVSQLSGAGVSLRLQGVQKALLRKAVQRCMPGGRIVYATCTYAPEENEAVVDAILKEYGDEVLRVIPVTFEGLDWEQGLTQWQGAEYHPDLHHALRIWPHVNNTGGFFIAVLEKLRWPVHVPEPVPLKEVVPDEEASKYLQYPMERFGFPEQIFDAYVPVKPGNKSVFLVSSPHFPPEAPMPWTMGMSAMRVQLRYPKLTTAAVMAFAGEAMRNKVTLDEKQLRMYLQRERVSLTQEQVSACEGSGYVMVCYRRWGVGIGVYRKGTSQLESLFPKGWAGDIRADKLVV